MFFVRWELDLISFQGCFLFLFRHRSCTTLNTFWNNFATWIVEIFHEYRNYCWWFKFELNYFAMVSWNKESICLNCSYNSSLTTDKQILRLFYFLREIHFLTKRKVYHVQRCNCSFKRNNKPSNCFLAAFSWKLYKFIILNNNSRVTFSRHWIRILSNDVFKD